MIYTRHTAKARNKIELIGTERLLINGRYELEDILKHSFNIIGLIEVGDIVETFDVLHNDIVYIWNEKMLKALKEELENGIGIKSIVTKELFNSIKYEVK